MVRAYSLCVRGDYWIGGKAHNYVIRQARLRQSTPSFVNRRALYSLCVRGDYWIGGKAHNYVIRQARLRQSTPSFVNRRALRLSLLG